MFVDGTVNEKTPADPAFKSREALTNANALLTESVLKNNSLFNVAL